MLSVRGTTIWFPALHAAMLCTFLASAQETRLSDLNSRAVGLYKEGKYAEAESLESEAARIAEATLSPDDIRIAGVLVNLARIYGAQEKHAEEEPLYLHALRIDEKSLGPESPFVASILNNLGVLYKEESRYAEAEPLYKRSLAIREKIFGPDSASVATLLNNLGTVYDDQGKYTEAESNYQRALKIDVKVLRADDAGLATDLNNLAELYQKQGKYADAEPMFRQALQIYEKALGPDHVEVATALNNLGELYKEEGKFAEAEPLFQRSLAIREKALGPNHELVGAALNNLGGLDDKEGRYADAEPMFRRALQIEEQALGPGNPIVAEDANNLGLLYEEEGRFVDAEPLFQRTLDIDEKALGENHPDTAKALNNLASLYDFEGKYAQAEAFYRRSLAIEERALGAENPEVANTLNNLASLFSAEGKFDAAEPVYQRAFSSLFQRFQYNFSFMTEKERLGFLDTVNTWFPSYFSFVHRSWKLDPILTGSMYNVLLWEKGLIAHSVADMQRQIAASGDTQAIQLLVQLSAKRTQIAALLRIQPPDHDLWVRELNQLQSESAEIETSLVARSTTFAARRNLERATWQQVRDALGPREAAIEFVHFRYMDKKWTDTFFYAALIVTHATKDHPAYIFLGEDNEFEAKTLAKFQHLVQVRGIAVEQDTTLPGKDAYELIWRPLKPALSGKTRIYVSPDGVLNQVPLGIIPTPGNKLLMERYDLRLVSSTKDILGTRPPTAANSALLIGDPSFDLSEAQQRAAINRLSLPISETKLEIPALSLGNPRRGGANETQLPRLPGTAIEMNTVSAIMRRHGWKVGVYSGDAALKREVEQVDRPRVLHLATHGFFLPDQQATSTPVDSTAGIDDPMLRSGLYFAGADRTLAAQSTPDDLDDGVLTAAEAGSLNLTGTELVVLSACNTGQGEVKNGEGVFGLRRAFQEAGANAVLMSLWSVPDKETQELMQIFYSKWLAGTEKHEALRQAQLEMRAKVKRAFGGRDMPYYWGAFVLVGQ
jgi:CHAT domain-containing protein/tetratricopeptide (TPR) repeat protein